VDAPVRVTKEQAEVLNRRNQEVLDALSPLPTPAGTLEPVLGRRIPEASFHPPHPPPTVTPRGRTVRLTPGRVDRFLVVVTLHGAGRPILGARALPT
jgi:hypothetical protein